MPGKHTEKSFEDAIEASLLAGGWKKGDPKTFDCEKALHPADLIAFIEATQPALMADLRKQHGPALEGGVIDTVVKALESRGTLDVLRHGIKFFGKRIDCAYFRPAHGLNPDVLVSYALNRLVVTRQVRFIADADESIDLLLSLNGLPIATAELKTPLTRQTVEHAVAQYKQRDHHRKLFEFKKRALVHFAVDPDLVYMTTKLAGGDTTFLPFNRGHAGGAGNPEHPSGYRTAYLWEEVWQRDSFLDIVGRFIHLLTEEKVVAGKKIERELVVFPRYHQLEVVQKLEAAAKVDGPGTSYLIQHSAGSASRTRSRGSLTALRACMTRTTRRSSTRSSSSPIVAFSTGSFKTPSTSSSTSRASSKRSTSTPTSSRRRSRRARRSSSRRCRSFRS